MGLSLPAANVIGGAISGGASILGSIMSHITARKQIAAQQRENQLNRDFNARQATLSRQHTLEMWNRNNSYNDPSAVMQRLRTAGIHPSLAFSQGTQGFSATMASSSAQAGYSGGITPTMPDYSGISNAGSAAAEAMRTISGAELNKSMQTLNDIQAQYYPQILKGEIDFLGVRIRMGNAAAGVDEQKAINLSRELGIIDESINLLKQQWVNEMVQGQLAGKQLDLLKPFVERAVEISEYKIGQLRNQYKMSETQASNLLGVIRAGIALQLAQAYEARGQGRVNHIIANMKGWYSKAYAAFAAEDASLDIEVKRAMERFYDSNGMKTEVDAEYRELEILGDLLGTALVGVGAYLGGAGGAAVGAMGSGWLKKLFKKDRPIGFGK